MFTLPADGAGSVAAGFARIWGLSGSGNVGFTLGLSEMEFPGFGIPILSDRSFCAITGFSPQLEQDLCGPCVTKPS